MKTLATRCEKSVPVLFPSSILEHTIFRCVVHDFTDLTENKHNEEMRIEERHCKKPTTS